MRRNNKTNYSITFDEQITLIKVKEIGFDKYGNVIESEDKTEVLCNKISASRDEFYRASQSGLKVSFIFTINEFEYDGQEIVEYEGDRYFLIRTYEYQDRELLEIVVGEKLGVNFEVELKKILDEFEKEVEDGVEKATDETAKETVKFLKANSPKNRGKYASGWTVKKESAFGVKSAIIHNAKYPGLTHLNEFGHAVSNQYGGTGKRVAGTPHIKPAEENAINLFEEKIRENIEG